MNETNANGEGSTKRAIRRGAEVSASSKRGTSSSFPSLTSVIAILVAVIRKLLLDFSNSDLILVLDRFQQMDLGVDECEGK